MKRTPKWGDGAPTHYNGVGNEGQNDVERVLPSRERIAWVCIVALGIWLRPTMDPERLVGAHEGQNLVLQWGGCRSVHIDI